MTNQEKLEKRVALYSESTEENSSAMFAQIVEAASRYWEGLDPYDFCVQYIGMESIVFGGSNRLIWNPFLGFFPDPSYCTEDFLMRCASLGRCPGRK